MGEGAARLGSRVPNTHTSKRYPRCTGHFEHTLCQVFERKKNSYPLGGGGGGPSSQVWGSGRSGVRKTCHVLHAYWDSHEFLSTLGVHTWGRNEIRGDFT